MSLKLYYLMLILGILALLGVALFGNQHNHMASKAKIFRHLLPWDILSLVIVFEYRHCEQKSCRKISLFRLGIGLLLKPRLKIIPLKITKLLFS